MLTWGISHEEVRSLLPMSQETLKAITQKMLMVGCAAGTIQKLWSAIEDRHCIFGYIPPLAMRGGDFSSYSKAVESDSVSQRDALASDFSYRGSSCAATAGTSRAHHSTTARHAHVRRSSGRSRRCCVFESTKSISFSSVMCCGVSMLHFTGTETRLLAGFTSGSKTRHGRGFTREQEQRLPIIFAPTPIIWAPPCQ